MRTQIPPAPTAAPAADLFESLLDEVAHLTALEERALAQEGRFSAAVVARVVEDLRQRRASLVEELEDAAAALVGLVERAESERDEGLGAVAGARFRLEERALLEAIGAEVADGGADADAARVADVDRRVQALDAEIGRQAALLARWTGLREEVGPEEAPGLVMDEGTDVERTYAIPEGPDGLRVGRGRGNDVALRDSKASRAHLRLRRAGPAVVVDDLGSANGTLVNGELIEAPRRLYGGEELIVGQTFLRFRAG
jgi:hypothetical protein